MARKQDTSETGQHASSEAWKQRRGTVALPDGSQTEVRASTALAAKRPVGREPHNGHSNGVSRERAEFAATLAHELRAPITVINGNARLLHDQRAALSSDQRSQALADICDEAERMRVLVEDLMTLAVSPDAADVVDELEPLPLAGVLESAIARHRRRHPDRAIELDAARSHRQAIGVHRYVEQIFDNLVNNAVKYSTPMTSIEVIVSETQYSIEVRVLDRGIGIDAQHVTRIFKPYFRSPEAAAMAPGTGIGLVVSKRLAEAQGGRIWARPREGGGSEFGFSLPIAEQQSLALHLSPDGASQAMAHVAAP